MCPFSFTSLFFFFFINKLLLSCCLVDGSETLIKIKITIEENEILFIISAIFLFKKKCF